MALRNKVLFTNEFGQLGINGASYEAGKDIIHTHLLGCNDTYLKFCNPLASGTPTMRLQLHTGYAQGGGDIGAGCCGIFVSGGKSVEAPVALIGSCLDLNSPKSALNDSSPELLFQTGATHYNWRIAVQETVNTGFEIASSTTVNDNAYTSSYTNRLVIEGDTGHVGIGTDDPRYDLAVKGDNATSVGIAVDNDSGSSTLDLAALGATYNAHGAAAGEVWFYSPDNINIGGATSDTNDIKFLGSGSERMRIASDGLTTITKDNSGVLYNSNLNPSLTLTNKNGTAGNFSTLSFNNGTVNTAYITTKHNRNGNNDGDLLFSTRNAAGSASIDMRINSNSTTSKIIIGRDNEVAGQIGDALITVGYPTGTNIAGGNMFIRGGTSTGNAAGGYISFATSPAGSSGTTSNAEVERMRITSDGNVSVNDTYNTAFMNTATAGRYIGVASNNSDALFIAHSSGEGVGYFGYDNSDDRLIIATDNGGGGNSIQFSVNAGATSTGAFDNLAAATAAMTIDASGNVGIGTDNPLLKLHVQGDVTGGAYNQAVGQIVISGETNTNKRLNIGFDTSTDKAFLQAGINGTGYNDLLLNPNGGTVCTAGVLCSSTCIRANTCVIAPTVCASKCMKGCVICGYRTGTGLVGGLRLERCDTAGAKTTCFLVSINPDDNCVVFYASCASQSGILCSAQTFRAPVMYTNDCFCTGGCVYAAGVVYSPDCLCSPVVRATSNLIPSSITCCNANIKTYTWPSILCGPTSTACSYCYHLVRWSYDPFNWGNGGFMEFTLTEWYYSHRGGRKKYRVHSNGYTGGTGQAPQVVLVDTTNRGGSTEAFGIKVVGPTVVDGTAPGQEYFDVYLATRCYHAVQVQMETNAQCTTSNPPENACIYICTAPTAQTDGTCFPICQIGSSSTECKCLGVAPFACGLEICGGTANDLSRHDATLYVKADNSSDWGIWVDKPDGAYLQKWVGCSGCAQPGLYYITCDGASSRSEFYSCPNGVTFSRSCFISPIVCGSSCVKGVITCGVTCGISPIFCGTSCVKGVITCGVTAVCSAVICATTTMQVGGNDVLTTASSVGANFCTNTDINNRVVTANGDAGSLCGEANLTFDGSTLNVTGAITASGDITSTSDERVKSNISEINGAIDIVSNLCGRIFIKDNKENVGVIAQEVEKILPQVVRNNPDGLKSVSYGNIVGVLIEAIKDQNKTIRDQNCRIENLEKIVQGR